MVSSASLLFRFSFASSCFIIFISSDSALRKACASSVILWSNNVSLSRLIHSSSASSSSLCSCDSRTSAPICCSSWKETRYVRLSISANNNLHSSLICANTWCPYSLQHWDLMMLTSPCYTCKFIYTLLQIIWYLKSMIHELWDPLAFWEKFS